jgi:retinol dehydrogenase 12
MDKAYQAVNQLRMETLCDEQMIRAMNCDLSSFDSVRRFAHEYNRDENRLDVLICNAGLAWSPYLVTKDGYNSVVQSNYLGHFLLTNLLLDKLKMSRPSRIVNVSSGAHKGQSFS